jgi:dihydrofolate reductase
MKVNLIVAATPNNGIGINGNLPWRLRNDMKYFQTLTTSLNSPNDHNACIMGRKTWDSIPKKFRPLKQRLNIVLSRTLQSDPDALFCNSLDEALQIAAEKNIDTAWIIGGAELYKMAAGRVDHMFLTRVWPKIALICDTFLIVPFEDFRKLDLDEFKAVLPNECGERQSEGEYEYEFQIWTRK